MISYFDMDNMYNYNASCEQNCMYNGNYYNSSYNNNYGSQPYYGYCPYRKVYENPMDYQRAGWPQNPTYYQYSPAVNCITPNYDINNEYNRMQGTAYNSELKMRTVRIEDIIE